MEKRVLFSCACLAVFSVVAFGMAPTSADKRTSAQVKKELSKTRSDIKKLESIKQKRTLSTRQNKSLTDLQKKELRLINRDIQLNPSKYLQEREKLEEKRKALKEEISQKEKMGAAPTELHAELNEVNAKIDGTKTIYEIQAGRNRDLDLWRKDQERNIERELDKTRIKLQKKGLPEAEIQKQIEAYRSDEAKTIKNKINNLKKEYDKELLNKYGLKTFPTPAPEEIERVAKEEISILGKNVK